MSGATNELSGFTYQKGIMWLLQPTTSLYLNHYWPHFYHICPHLDWTATLYMYMLCREWSNYLTVPPCANVHTPSRSHACRTPTSCAQDLLTQIFCMWNLFSLKWVIQVHQSSSFVPLQLLFVNMTEHWKIRLEESTSSPFLGELWNIVAYAEGG